MTHTDYHVPVLLRQSLDVLITDPDGIYIDGTLGAGGHTRALLDRLGKNARVFGIDQDEDALQACSDIQDPRFTALRGNFGFMDALIPAEFRGKITGILLDLGVSSHQIDAPERGFSFQTEGPLDMRMGSMIMHSAHEILNTYSVEQLSDIFFRYGEERHSRAIARSVEQSRPLRSTSELRKAVEKVIKGPHLNKSLARIFQAIRIEVNRELDMLERALERSIDLLCEGGRIVIISYHSLEDRLVKYFFRSGRLDGELEKDFYGNPITPFVNLTRNAVTADEHEIAENPRSRSARLRAAERHRQEVAA
jgi:16S rRNA (cytosine1402-N4)-methyltransferase